MDFAIGLPRSVKKNEAIWVVVDSLTKIVYFMPVKMTFSVERFAQLYIEQIVRFTTKFWKNLQTARGIKLNFRTTYHPQTDGQSERIIQTLEDILRSQYWILVEVGRHIYHLWHLHTTVTKQPSEWHRLTHCMDKNVDPHALG